MKTTPAERLIIAMLADIGIALKLKGDIDPVFVKDALYSNDMWAIRWKYSFLFSDTDSEAPDEVNEVAEILSMWRDIEQSFGILSQKEKERVTKESYPYSTQFQGFDANNEEHYGIAAFMIKNLKRFEEFSERELNSHSPSIAKYKRMLDIYDGMARHTRDSLSADQIIAIVKG